MRRLILGPGAGHVKQPGDVLVDRLRLPGVDFVMDLDRLPWPFSPDSYDHVEGFHLIEHLHAGLIQFMDQCWRVLRPGGTLYLTTPLAGADGDPDLQWCDPTHVRPGFRPHSFLNYLTPEGIARFGYTALAWHFTSLTVDAAKVLHVRGTPIKEPVA